MKVSKIHLPEEHQPKQLALFKAEVSNSSASLYPFPEVLRSEQGFDKVLYDAKDCLGIDFEFNSKNEKPSIIGIATRTSAASVPWSERLGRKVVDHCAKNAIKLVGHSVIGSDRPVLEKALNIVTPIEAWEDTMREFYLCYQDFVKSSDKESDGEGSLGFMNLWVMGSMTTNAFNWKTCRGRACSGPCPSHDVFGYNGVDAWVGVEGHYVLQAEMNRMKVPYQFYRELMEIAEICDKMERRGIRVNLDYIDILRKDMEDAKDAIFSYTENGTKRYYDTFNPRSSQQVIEWFGQRGLSLATADIKYVQKILEKRAAKAEIGDLKDFVEHVETNPHLYDEVTKELNKLYVFKSSGKGPDAWFDEKYRVHDFVHPRFVDTGTSSGRLSSSRPNFQNIPVRGWAVVKNPDGTENHKIKTAIIPRDESLDFIEADYAQLELRTVLYLAGVDPSEAGNDAFTWLVNQNLPGFTRAAELWPGLDHTQFKDVRYVAKSLAHAANYMEGLDIYYPDDLMKPHIKRQLENGSIRLYKDWEYCGGLVGFTGSNLAQRFFGARTEENRKLALDIQEDVYFKTFSMIRGWQQRVLSFIESNGYVQSPTGRFLRLYDSPRDNAKVGVASLGQGLGADHATAVILRYYRTEGFLFDLTVHDSVLAGIPKSWDDKKAYAFIEPMAQESGIRLPGFKAPIDVKRGPNYGEMRKLKI